MATFESKFFETSRFSIPFHALKVEKVIGEGNFGSVYKATFKGKPIAVKQLYNLDDDDLDLYFEREMSILGQLKHKNVVRLLGLSREITREEMNYFMITEFIGGGDLRKKLKTKSVVIDWPLKMRILIDIAEGLQYLASKEIVHRDLKSHNLLVDDDWTIKICDFGFARKVENVDYMTICGTDEWMAPEIALGDKYDERVDIFSFGMIIIEVLTRKKPPKRKESKHFKFEPERVFKAIPEETPAPLRELVQACAEFYPENRPAWPAILKTLREVQQSIDDAEKAKEKGKVRSVDISSSTTYGMIECESSDDEEEEQVEKKSLPKEVVTEKKKSKGEKKDKKKKGDKKAKKEGKKGKVRH